MNEQKPPREWYLDAQDIAECTVLDAYPVNEHQGPPSVNEIHVIEKRAYDLVFLQATNAFKEYDRLRDHAEKLATALEHLDCKCSIKEKLSGHLVDCNLGTAMEMVAEYRKAFPRGEKC